MAIGVIRRRLAEDRICLGATVAGGRVVTDTQFERSRYRLWCGGEVTSHPASPHPRPSAVGLGTEPVHLYHRPIRGVLAGHHVPEPGLDRFLITSTVQTRETTRGEVGLGFVQCENFIGTARLHGRGQVAR